MKQTSNQFWQRGLVLEYPINHQILSCIPREYSSVSTLWLNIIFILSGHQFRCQYQFPKGTTSTNTPHSQLGEVMVANLQWESTVAGWTYTCYPTSHCQWGQGLMGNHRGAYVANQHGSTGLYWGFLSSVAWFWSLWSSNGCFGGYLRDPKGIWCQTGSGVLRLKGSLIGKVVGQREHWETGPSW